MDTTPKPIPDEPEAVKVATPSPAWALPTKSRTLREVRKVFPKARFQESTSKGIKSVELFYKIPGTKGEDAPVCNVTVPPGGNVAGACVALLTAAFARYGYTVRWEPLPWPGRFVKEAIPNFVGVEQHLPIELDPEVMTEAEFTEAGKIADDIKAGVYTKAEGYQHLITLYGKALARKAAAEGQAQ